MMRRESRSACFGLVFLVLAVPFAAVGVEDAAGETSVVEAMVPMRDGVTLYADVYRPAAIEQLKQLGAQLVELERGETHSVEHTSSPIRGD